MSCFRSCKKAVSYSLSYIFEYDTPKFLVIKSIKVGIIFRFVQLAILAYIIGWVMIYKKEYQEKDAAVSAVVTKVKGIALTNISDVEKRLWDVAEYVYPAQEKDAFFIATNAVITFNQTQADCPEDPDVPGAICQSDSDCTPIIGINLGNGVRTHRCVNTTKLDGSPVKTCEIYGWCPVERENPDKLKIPLLSNVPDFTVLIKNSIEFPIFGKKRFNIPESEGKVLNNCTYDKVKSPLCPVFRIGTILDQTGTKYSEIGSQGGIIAINIVWDCDFDKSEDYCWPVYSFKRLDAKYVRFGKGWNFRRANHYWVDGKEYRDFYKLFGIRFLVLVTGKAGRFNMIPFTMNLGSGLALFGLATVFCDLIVLWFLNKRNDYREEKYKLIEGDDAYKTLEDSVNQPQ